MLRACVGVSAACGETHAHLSLSTQRSLGTPVAASTCAGAKEMRVRPHMVCCVVCGVWCVVCAGCLMMVQRLSTSHILLMQWQRERESQEHLQLLCDPEKVCCDVIL